MIKGKCGEDSLNKKNIVKICCMLSKINIMLFHGLPKCTKNRNICCLFILGAAVTAKIAFHGKGKIDIKLIGQSNEIENACKVRVEHSTLKIISN